MRVRAIGGNGLEHAEARPESLTLTLDLRGADCVLNSYSVKALPGVKRQRAVQVTVAVADRETDRLGHRSIDLGSARSRAEALFALSERADASKRWTNELAKLVQIAETAPLGQC